MSKTNRTRVQTQHAPLLPAGILWTLHLLNVCFDG